MEYKIDKEAVSNLIKNLWSGELVEELILSLSAIVVISNLGAASDPEGGNQSRI